MRRKVPPGLAWIIYVCLSAIVAVLAGAWLVIVAMVGYDDVDATCRSKRCGGRL